MEIPDGPFVALYGSHSGDWRLPLIARFEREGVAWFDPTNEGWDGIDATNGDARQTDIDALVAREHAALQRAGCVVFYLARRRREQGRETGATTIALASRCEFGFLIGRGIPTCFHIEPDVEGRNYLWAAALNHPHMVRCDSLDEAVARAISRVRKIT